jgi:hypothetical protein
VCFDQQGFAEGGQSPRRENLWGPKKGLKRAKPFSASKERKYFFLSSGLCPFQPPLVKPREGPLGLLSDSPLVDLSFDKVNFS